jgi:hypothetical protein
MALGQKAFEQNVPRPANCGSVLCYYAEDNRVTREGENDGWWQKKNDGRLFYDAG